MNEVYLHNAQLSYHRLMMHVDKSISCRFSELHSSSNRFSSRTINTIPFSMDVILGFQPRDRIAIAEMDRQTLESVRLAIIRAYTELGISSTILDVGTLAGSRALCRPYSLKHICRSVVRSLKNEGFEASWDRTGLFGSPYMVNVSWSAALKRATRMRKARRSHRNHTNGSSLIDHGHHQLERESPIYTSRFWDESSEVVDLELDALVNPSKLRNTTMLK